MDAHCSNRPSSISVSELVTNRDRSRTQSTPSTERGSIHEALARRRPQNLSPSAIRAFGVEH